MSTKEIAMETIKDLPEGATRRPLSPEKPECRVASLVFHHGHSNGINADHSKQW
jgi:hypothetical protein